MILEHYTECYYYIFQYVTLNISPKSEENYDSPTELVTSQLPKQSDSGTDTDDNHKVLYYIVSQCTIYTMILMQISCEFMKLHLQNTSFVCQT